MRFKKSFSILLPAAFLCPVTASAHHSSAAFDTSKTVEIAGTVSEYSFRNPHVYMTIKVTTDSGVREVEIEAGAGSVIGPLGFTRDAVKVGDVVTVIGNPGRRKPDELLLGRELYHQDGSYLPLNISSRSIFEASEETATSIEGTWFPPRTSFFGYLGGTNAWSLTDAARANSVSDDPLGTTQKDCVPIGAPALMVYPVAITVDVEETQVVMDIDWLDSVRTVYLDGREHPPANQIFLHGFSTGRWDGDALVVETTNFDEHVMGTSMAVPGSTRKVLTERFEISEDGKEMIYSGVVTDPVYLAEPAEWSASWLYRPAMEHSNEACNLETARRFLND